LALRSARISRSLQEILFKILKFIQKKSMRIIFLINDVIGVLFLDIT